MGKISVTSYAKVNLTLEVLAKRDDGYHDIDSVAQVIDLADLLSVEEAPEGVIEVSVANAPDVPAGPDNFVYRACLAFMQATGIRAGARFELNKRIPAQAGLGGGSGNAAAAIVALNQLYGSGLTRNQLANIASLVSSDAPLFIWGGTVRMRGRGEVVMPLPDAPQLHMVILKPAVGISTAWAYAELDRISGQRSTSASETAETAVRSGDGEALVRALYNDFEQVVCGAFPQIDAAKRALLESGAKKALLAGSGSAVFGVFASASEAGTAAERLSPDLGEVYVTRCLRHLESDLVVDNGDQ